MNSELDYLYSTQAVRERSQKLWDLTVKGEGQFRIVDSELTSVRDFVVETIQENYPDLKIPYHSRWGHFRCPRLDRVALLDEKLAPLAPLDRARAKWDLAFVSVLLDAGAGMGWKYKDSQSGGTYSKSEGLAIVSFNMFMQGLFSSDKSNPYQADAQGLAKLKISDLIEAFQVRPENPLLGVEGRLTLLQNLGKTLQGHNLKRPGDLVETFASQKTVLAHSILKTVLLKFSTLWPGRLTLEGHQLGDTWSHPLLGTPQDRKSLVPFHKLSQWLTYSLVEPLEELGLNVTRLDDLTGLPEYRNGGLFVDLSFFQLKESQLFRENYRADSALVIEWRALTVIALDKLVVEVRKVLKLDAQSFPLTKLLEGGTWRAGRKVAAKLRSDGGPPLNIISDGTVF